MMTAFRIGILALSLLTFDQLRMGTRLVQPAGNVLTASDFTYEYTLTLPTSGHAVLNDDIIFLANGIRRVGGVNHFFLSQERSGTFAGSWSVYEFADPGSAGTATKIKNWGYNNGATHDLWGGRYGRTYNSGGTLENLGGTATKDNLMIGLSYRDSGVGSGQVCASYSLPYGAYQMAWNLVCADLVTPGSGTDTPTGLSTTAYGPFRICAGYITVGHGSQECGPNRAGFLVTMPDGSMGFAQGHSYTQQDRLNRGPSLWGGLSWITSSQDSSFGSTRGTATYRTTDIIPTVNYLSHYSIDGQITVTGTMVGGAPNISARRPPHVGGNFTNYIYEGYSCGNPAGDRAMEELDPDLNGGIGSATSRDGFKGMVYVPGTKTGWIAPATASVSHTWYRSNECQSFIGRYPIESAGGPQYCPRHGVDPTVSVTGPVSVRMEPALLVYDPADLTGSGTEYAPDPDSWVWFEDISPSATFAPHSSTTGNIEGQVGGAAFDPVERKLYVSATGADTTTVPGLFYPLIHVYTLAGSSSVPEPILPWAAGAAVLALGSLLTRRRATA